MTTDKYLLKSLWIAFITLMVMTTVVASNSGAQGGVADVGKDITVDFGIIPSGVSVPPSFQIAGMTFFAHSSSDFNVDPFMPFIADWGPPYERSYVIPNEGVTVVLPLEAWAVEVRLCHAGLVLAEAYSSTGILVTQEHGQSYACHDLLLLGALDSELISIVRFTGGLNEASIARLRAIVGAVPLVDAGQDQFVAAGESVRLSGTVWDPYTGITPGMFDTRSCPAETACTTDYYPEFRGFWEQTGGTEVLLKADPFLFEAGFISPDASVTKTLTFRLTVTDNYDGGTASDDVKVVVLADE